MRGGLPHAIESTWYLTEAILTDESLPGSISAFAVKSCYCTAICRFVTGLLDSEQDSYHKQSMYNRARQLNLPASLVELRHEVTHGEIPSLVVLRQSALRSLDWLRHDYWRHLGEDNTDTASRTREQAISRNNLKDLLKSHVRTFMTIRDVPDSNRRATLIQEAIDATLECLRVCVDGTRELRELVHVCVHDETVSMGKQECGIYAPCNWMTTDNYSHEPLSEFSLQMWDSVLQTLALRHIGFLQMLSDELFERLAQPLAGNAATGDPKEAALMWLEHIYTSKDWRKAFKQSGLDELRMVSLCLQSSHLWTLRLASSITNCPENVRLRRVFGDRIAKALEDGEDRGGTSAGQFASSFKESIPEGFSGWQRSTRFEMGQQIGVR
ncbi:MAG: hypothetical protein Q9174_001609 [Haloplaca sp. 1 TL-2023]